MSKDLTSAPQDDEQDYYSKNDHKNYEQAYYIGHPARRQRIIDVPIMCFVFISFHVATPLVSVPPLLKIRHAKAQSISASIEAVCRKTLQEVNRDSEAQSPTPKIR